MKNCNTKFWSTQTWKIGPATLPFTLVGPLGVAPESRAAAVEARAGFFQEVRELRFGTYVDFAREEFWNQFGLFHIYSGDPLWPVFAEKMA